jgi:hypothetical protein
VNFQEINGNAVAVQRLKRGARGLKGRRKKEEGRRMKDEG